MGSLLMHVSIPGTLFSLGFLYFSFSFLLLCFLYFLIFLSTSLFFCLPLFLLLLVSPLVTIHDYSFLYCLLRQDLPFLPFNHFWLVVGVLPRLPTGLPAA